MSVSPSHVWEIMQRDDDKAIQAWSDADVQQQFPEAERNATPLHFAAALNAVKCIEELIARGANIEADDEDGVTPLMDAVSCGHYDAAALLLQHNAVVDKRDGSQNTVIERALVNGHPTGHQELIQLLQEFSGAGSEGVDQNEELLSSPEPDPTLPTNPADLEAIRGTTEHTPLDFPRTISERGLRVLCLDGGGIRGIIPLVILKQLVELCASKEPYQVFDVICGTSTGCLLAVMLGMLRIPVADCTRIYEKFGKQIFKSKSVAGAVRYALLNKPAYDAKTLVSKIKEILRTHEEDRLEKKGINKADFQHAQMKDFVPQRSEIAHVFVTSNLNNSLHLFRNYHYSHADTNGSSDVFVWEALRATSAAPSYFRDFNIANKGVFLDGGIGWNNPTEAMLEEIVQIFGSSVTLNCILSLGTGRCTAKATKGGFRATLSIVTKVTTDTEAVHQRMSAKFQDRPDLYFRLNPPELGDIPLDDHGQIPFMSQQTNKYLHGNRTLLNRLKSVVSHE